MAGWGGQDGRGECMHSSEICFKIAEACLASVKCVGGVGRVDDGAAQPVCVCVRNSTHFRRMQRHTSVGDN